MYKDAERGVKVLTAAISMCLAAPVGANTITVNGGSASDCTLIKAIATANDGFPQDPCEAGDPSGPDTIELNVNQYLQGINNTIDGNNGLPSVTSTITINGNGHKIARSNSASAFRIFHVASGGDLTLKDANVSGGLATTGSIFISFTGGGIVNRGTLSLENSSVTGNSASNYGGGIYSKDATLTLTSSSVSGNSAGSKAGGIDIEAGTMSATGSEISGNAVTSASGLSGGGLQMVGAVVTMSNSTISGNSTHSNGGGVYAVHSTTTLTNCTISGNTAGGGGGVYNNGPSSTTLINSIVASNLGGDCNGTIHTNGNNWFGDATCSGTAQGDPELGPLTDNGGPTKTHKLLTGSGAIDAGEDAICAAAPVNGKDQRGETRPQGAHCDIGAYEAIAAAPPPDETGFFVIPLGNGKAGVFGL